MLKAGYQIKEAYKILKSSGIYWYRLLLTIDNIEDQPNLGEKVSFLSYFFYRKMFFSNLKKSFVPHYLPLQGG
jgi:hypothetical protein